MKQTAASSPSFSESSPLECRYDGGVPGSGAVGSLESLVVWREFICCMSRVPAGEPCLGKRLGTLEGCES